MYKLTENCKREFGSVVCKHLLHTQKRPIAICHDEIMKVETKLFLLNWYIEYTAFIQDFEANSRSSQGLFKD